jgi:hypothetical protein
MNKYHVGDDLMVDGVHQKDKEQGNMAISGSERLVCPEGMYEAHLISPQAG